MLIPFYAFSQEDKKELQVTQFNVVTPVFCGATEKFNEVFPKENLKFTRLHMQTCWLLKHKKQESVKRF